MSWIIIHRWSVHDRTTGPVLPPAAPAVQTLFVPQSEFRSTRKRKIFPASATSVVIAIPVSDFWFDALDVPVRIKTKGKLTETVQPLVPQAPPPALNQNMWFEALNVPVRIKTKGKFTETVQPLVPQGAATPSAPFAYASSGQIVIHGWSIYDVTTGPVLPQLAPPPIRPLIDAQSDIRPRPRKKFMPLSTSVVIALPVDDLWFETLDVPVRLKTKGRFAETVQGFEIPVAPPIPVPVPEGVPQGQILRNEILRTRTLQRR